jgi:hypothetical protein
MRLALRQADRIAVRGPQALRATGNPREFQIRPRFECEGFRRKGSPTGTESQGVAVAEDEWSICPRSGSRICRIGQLHLGVISVGGLLFHSKGQNFSIGWSLAQKVS